MNLDIIASLQTTFGILYDENFKPRDKVVYNKKIVDFNKELEEVGISPKLTPKEIELKLQQIHELLEKKQEPLTKTTLNKDESEQFIKEAGQREANIKETREGQTKAVEDFIKRNQEQVAKAQAVQEKLKEKKVYAKVIIPDKPLLNETEQKDLEILKEFAQGDEVTRTKLIDDLAEKIEEKISPTLENATKTEVELIARSTAVEIVTKLAQPEIAAEIPVGMAILNTISKDTKTIQNIVKDDTLLEIAKKGSTLIALENKNKELTSKTIIQNLFGQRLAIAINGYSPEQIQVILSETKIEGQTTHEISLGNINQNHIQILQQQNELIKSAQEFGIDRTRGYFSNQANVYIVRQIEKLPAGSVIKKAYSSPITQTILARYGLAQPVVWETVGQTGFVKLAMQIAPDTAGPMLSLAGKVLGKEFVKPIATKIAAGVAVKTGVAASLSATLSATFGSFAPIIGHAIGAIVGWIGGELFSKLKTWWTKHKEDIKPFLAIIAGGLGLMFGGPAVGGLALLGGLAVTGTLGAFAMGAFGVFGFIGRSVGIAIATPVIVTLLVLPPLVAFIMLVINNSAYVVPPKPVAESGFEPGGSGFSCTTEKTPTSITSSINSPIATRAWEIMEDMYQGFWCFWNRSPGDLPTDTIAYAPSYPELFNMDLFRRTPNPTREQVSSCGECLFWCTWLVQKSYKENGISILYTLWSPSMYDDFKSRGKLLNTSQETPTGIQPGAVIFFDVDNGLNRIDHVGVVHSVNAGGVTFLQSNAGTKDDFIPFGSNGLQDLPGITVVGVGNP